MNIEKEREAFENWVTDGDKYPEFAEKTTFGTYKLTTAYMYWQAWEERAKRDKEK